jgi:hypothetical protein
VEEERLRREGERMQQEKTKEEERITKKFERIRQEEILRKLSPAELSPVPSVVFPPPWLSPVVLLPVPF